MRRILWGLLPIAALLAMAGCASTPEPPGDAVEGELSNAPDWVRKGCAAYWEDEEDKRICGVGSVGSTRNASLARSGALARARTEIARTLDLQVQAMLKDYQATTTGGPDFGTASGDDQHVVDVSRQITDLTVAGTEMVDSWISKSGTFYVLVSLDVERFKDAVSQMGNLNEAVRRAVVERAEQAFQDLDEQIEKNRQ